MLFTMLCQCHATEAYEYFSFVSMYVQGNFFQNIGSITLFAVLGTAISAFIVGGGIYFLGQVRIVFVSVNKSGPVQRKSLNLLVK